MIGAGPVILAEVAEVLAAHGTLVATGLDVDRIDEGQVEMRILVSAADQPTPAQSFDTVEFYEAARRLRDIASLRLIVSRYQMDPEALQTLLDSEAPSV